jgi:hypothetical protein
MIVPPTFDAWLRGGCKDKESVVFKIRFFSLFKARVSRSRHLVCTFTVTGLPESWGLSPAQKTQFPNLLAQSKLGRLAAETLIHSLQRVNLFLFG